MASESEGIPPSQPFRTGTPSRSAPAAAQANPVGSGDTWVAVNPGGLRWSLWDCDNVVFHKETGETHLLNALPTLVLQMVQSSPIRTTGELCRESADACGALADGPWQQKIHSVLRNLEHLELIERLPVSGA